MTAILPSFIATHCCVRGCVPVLTPGLASCKFLLVPWSLPRTPLLTEVTSQCVLYGTQSWEWFSLFNQLFPQQGVIETIKLYFRHITAHYNEVYQNECLAGVSGSCSELFIFIYILRLLRSIGFPGMWFKWVFKIFLCVAALAFQAPGSSPAQGRDNLCGFPDMDGPSH